MNRPDDQPPALSLATATDDEYCNSILRHKAEMWWFQTGLAPYRGYSTPFRDAAGRWWWRGQIQFGWPLDLFTPFSSAPRLPFGKCGLGRQYPVPRERANSLAHFNVIHDLTDFGIERVAAKKRRAVRKGLRGLELTTLCDDPAVREEVREVWNSHVTRTSWNKTFDESAFAEQWRALMDMPGTTIVGGRDRSTGALCAWVLGRIVGETVWVDTLASHSDRLDHRPNDTVIFALLVGASRLGVKKANYFLRSAIEPLESFKQSLGFVSDGIPARLEVNPAAKVVLKLARKEKWRRIEGDINRDGEESASARKSGS